MAEDQNKKQSQLPTRVARSVVRSLILVILIVTLVCNFIGLYIFYRYSVDELYYNAHAIASECAAYVDGEHILGYLEGNQVDRDFIRTTQSLQTVLEQEECVSIYVAVLDAEAKTRTYIVDVVSEESGYTPYEIGYTDSYAHHTAKNQAYLENAAKGLYHNTDIDVDKAVLLTKSKHLGHYIEVVEPVYTDSSDIVAFVCVIKQENELYESLHNYSVQVMLFGIAFSVIASVLMILLMRKRFVIPLNEIVEETDRFRKEKTPKDAVIVFSNGLKDEFAYLANSLSQMEKDIHEQFDQIQMNTKEKSKLDAELHLAQQIQLSAIPKITDALLDSKEFELGAMMQAAKHVGGDFYDFYYLDSDHLVLTIADVSDKGIAAAMFMMMSKFLIKERAMIGGKPSEIIRDVNELICKSEDTENFVTVWLGILDVRTGEILAANAGHEYPILQKSGKYETYKEPHGLPIGVIGGVTYQDYTIQLEKGDCLFVYTDGLAEANNPKGEQYGVPRIVDSLNELQVTQPAKMVEEIWKNMNLFADSAEQFDDTTMLCLRFLGPDDSKHLEIDAESEKMDILPLAVTQSSVEEGINFLEQKMLESQADEALAMKMNVVADEVLSNIVQYSGADKMSIGFLRKDGVAYVQFCDNGVAYDPTKQEEGQLSDALESEQIGGWGILIVKKLMDDVQYTYMNGENVLRVCKRIESI